MNGIDILSAEGAVLILRQLSTGESQFKDLNEAVKNTRTLTKRLKELYAVGLIQKVGAHYRITDEGFDLLIQVLDVGWKSKVRGINEDEFAKIRHRWLKVSLRRLVELFFEGFGEQLISMVLYGSLVKDTFELGRSDIDLLYIIEDGAGNLWKWEEEIFKRFKLSWEYRACDHWLKLRGFYGYPEVTTAGIRKGYAQVFQPMYLDMLLHRAVLYDKEGFFDRLLQKLQKELRSLGAVRVEYADGVWCWFLKRDLAPGELITIDLK